MNGGTVWATVFQESRLNGILCLISFFLFSLDLQIAVYINLKCLFSYTISLTFTVLILNINFKVNRYDIECALGFFRFLTPKLTWKICNYSSFATHFSVGSKNFSMKIIEFCRKTYKKTQVELIIPLLLNLNFSLYCSPFFPLLCPVFLSYFYAIHHLIF